jgi:hypothetical protein
MRKIRHAFYWLGMSLAVVCFVLVFGRNSELVWRSDYLSVPLSWVAGALAILAFLGTEFCDWVFATPAETEISADLVQQEF